jgi:hypothetical protein
MQPICWFLLETIAKMLEEDIPKNSSRLILLFEYKAHGKRALRQLMMLMLLISEIRVGFHVKAQPLNMHAMHLHDVQGNRAQCGTVFLM